MKKNRRTKVVWFFFQYTIGIFLVRWICPSLGPKSFDKKDVLIGQKHIKYASSLVSIMRSIFCMKCATLLKKSYRKVHGSAYNELI